MDLDLAYENGAFIPDGETYAPKWSDAAARFREIETLAGRSRLNVPYGTGERQVMDIFYPAGQPVGLVVFVHGGYWRALDHRYWSYLAAGATARGWGVAMPSYTLAPAARIHQITREIAQAVGFGAAQIAGPIVVTGHSAGGHLCARLMCRDVELADDVAGRIKRCVPISCLSDLRPIALTKMNDDLRLDADEAAAESPVLCRNTRDIPVTVWVGGEERPVFLDQSNWLVKAWPQAKLRIASGRHHFDVIEEMEQPHSPLTEALVGGL
jgi:arylformamidase